MSMRDKSIRIDDWAGRTLFIGEYDSPEVDQILDANRCSCEEGCTKCDHSRYFGDFEVYWIDEGNDHLNVYEYIKY